MAFPWRADRLLTNLGLLRHPTKDYGNRHSTATTWASTSTKHNVSSSHEQQSFKASQASPVITAMCYASKHMAPSQGAPIIRGSGAIHFPCYPGCHILPPRIALRTWRQVGRPSPRHPPAPSRPKVVDPCSQPRKWQEHPPTNRVSLHTLRQFGVWLGSGTKR
jgi:hypothetical protein